MNKEVENREKTVPSEEKEAGSNGSIDSKMIKTVNSPEESANDKEVEIAIEDVYKAQQQMENILPREEEDDDAPEDVSWKASKEITIQERTKKNQVLNDAKRKEKQARIERNERLREQKERKRARDFSRLPEELLEIVAKQQPVERSAPMSSHLAFDTSSEREEEENISVEPEDTHGVKVLVLPKEVKKPKKVQESAEIFLQQHLYGARLRRIPVTKAMDLTRKKTRKPSIKFARK